MENKYIVAEVTKNWTKETLVSDLLSQKFERVINVNFERGYKLTEWKISQVFSPTTDTFTETIIAIFEKI